MSYTEKSKGTYIAPRVT